MRKYIKVFGKGGKVHRVDKMLRNDWGRISNCGIEYDLGEKISAEKFNATDPADLCKRCFKEGKK
ncbi:hypothetical protein LCGC14_1091980 [marine sediment metagenome]|uniref:Uncharacterized protein n=1 Tax=marine sediment metagenome TaxID=412755 RepID=A0A0F9MGD4_9ZZZZ